MTDTLLWGNFATTTLDANITNVATSLTVASGDGALFPSPAAGEYVKLVLEDSSGNREVIHMTARATDTFTIVRAQESTSGQAFSTGDRVEMRLTSGFLEKFIDGGTF